jgi:hypothetical protein
MFTHVLDERVRTVFERDLPACPDAFLKAAGRVACFLASVTTGRPEPASWLPTPRALAKTSTLGLGFGP